jgi:hypothetical protein
MTRVLGRKGRAEHGRPQDTGHGTLAQWTSVASKENVLLVQRAAAVRMEMLGTYNISLALAGMCPGKPLE